MPKTLTHQARRAARAALCATMLALAAPVPSLAQTEGTITPNYKDADLSQIIEAVSAVTGKNFIVDPRVRALFAKARDFSEQDKQTLRAVELEILGRVVTEYRDGAERGQIEISTSPFYHPILPLLCDASVFLGTHPSWPPPEQPFVYPQDASEQLRRATALHQRLFGRAPVGLWPSEGSVSDAMVPLVAEAGFSWMATDEEILARSLPRTFARDADLYRAYRVGPPGADVACAFRDHLLSDLVGFTYSSWDPHAAADDFVNRIAGTGERGRFIAQAMLPLTSVPPGDYVARAVVTTPEGTAARVRPFRIARAQPEGPTRR